MKTRKLTSMAILAALSVILVAAVHIPMPAPISFLEYDPADIPILICGFAFGPVAGLADMPCSPRPMPARRADMPQFRL